MQKILQSTIDLILPPRCPVTGDMVDAQGMVSPQFWAGLDFIAAPSCVVCSFPFDFEVDEGTQCSSCLSNPPPYKTARAALKYNENSREIILGFKHADKTHAVVSFLPWLKSAAAEMLAEADLLVPVPLHRWRLLARRYNQAALMAQLLSKDTGIDYIPDALERIKSTPSQGHLNAKERRRNVRRAFRIHKRFFESVKGKTIILVDDVYTTGATVQECTRALLKGGAKAVHVLTLARVVRAGFD